MKPGKLVAFTFTALAFDVHAFAGNYLLAAFFAGVGVFNVWAYSEIEKAEREDV